MNLFLQPFQIISSRIQWVVAAKKFFMSPQSLVPIALNQYPRICGYSSNRTMASLLAQLRFKMFLKRFIKLSLTFPPRRKIISYFLFYCQNQNGLYLGEFCYNFSAPSEGSSPQNLMQDRWYSSLSFR